MRTVSAPGNYVEDLQKENQQLNATPITNLIRVNILVVIDGEAVAEVDCADYDAFKKLPDAIKIEGKALGKSGWSSDRKYCCYRSGVMLGQILDVKG